MKLKEYQIVLAVVLAPLVLLWGCQGNKLVSPTRTVSLGVAFSTKGLAKSKLFNTTEDMVLYNVSGPNSAPVTGSVGPFNTNYGSGSVSFVLNNVPVGEGEILSVELEDSTVGGTPEGIGAVELNNVANGVTVEMGSLVRNCYAIYPAQTYSCYEAGGGYFTFNGYYVDYNAGVDRYDIHWVGIEDNSENCTGEYDMIDGWTGSEKSIAYLGNGPLVNFDSVPASGKFYSSASAAKEAVGANGFLEQGDVYCVKIEGGVGTDYGTGGHAWMQIISPGYTYVSPSFRFRLRNDSTPYYLIDESYQDMTVQEEENLDCDSLDDQGWD